MVRVWVIWYSLRSCTKDISPFVIINPRQEMVWECGWRHPRKRWSWEFEDFEKTSVGFSPLKDVVGYSKVKTRVGSSTIEAYGQVLPISTDGDLKHNKMQRALGWGQHSMVSIGFCELCLSPRVAMDRSQKLVNPFVPETTESACFACVYVLYTTWRA